eukprot:15437706-Alexandrium_andersonii.AAC.1
MKSHALRRSWVPPTRWRRQRQGQRETSCRGTRTPAMRGKHKCRGPRRSRTMISPRLASEAEAELEAYEEQG